MSGEAETPGAMKTAITEGTKLLSTLPAQFLMLVLLNVLFISGALWFLKAEDETHARIIAPILDTCARSVPVEVLQQVLKTVHQE